MKNPLNGDVAAVFSTQLGWISVSWQRQKVCRLSFGHASQDTASVHARGDITPAARLTARQQDLILRLKEFAKGGDEDFGDVPIEIGGATSFQQQIYDQCRRLRRGETASYQLLAARAGRPRAARAVGNAMAKNPIPLIIPCHRVVAANAQGLGGFSAPGGLSMKRRLLELESCAD